MLKRFAIGLALLLFILGWLLWPVYEFFAHRGKAPFPAFYEYVAIPDTSPTDETLLNADYQAAGAQAKTLLTTHRKAINAPAISAAVAIDGELVWAATSGWADIEAAKPASTQTQFRIGSTSKALTSAGLARMVQNGVLALDTPIVAYSPNLPNEHWNQITARQLVSHMAGMPHYKENTDYFGLYQSMRLSYWYEDVDDALAVFDDSELLFAPGQEFYYSSLGTVLLSAVMQDATGQRYQQWMQEQVFTPLHMTSTGPEHDFENSIQLATFYWNNQGLTEQVRPWRDVDLSHRLAGGGFVSTSSDLARLGIAMLDERFVRPDIRDEFWTPQTLPSGENTPGNYALGWRVLQTDIEGFGAVTHANHGGVSRGAQSWLMVLPEYNMSVAVNINANTDVFWDFGRVSMQVAQLFLQQQARLAQLDNVQVAEDIGNTVQ